MIKIIKRKIYKFLILLNPFFFVKVYNYLNKFYWKYPFKLELSSKKLITLTSLDQDNITLSISKQIRIIRYKDGIYPFLQKLIKQYCIDLIEFHDGDVVIDCGANIGEVGLWFKKLNKNITVYAIEPETKEADACDQNIYSGKPITIRKALWKEEGTLSFFSNNSTGDSSLFEQDRYDCVNLIETITLEKIFIEKNINHVRLFKLEAEGAEPEILMGAVNVLSKIDYISVDCGPERGISMEPTFMPVYDYLLAHGFILVDIKFDRIVALFKRVDI